MFLLFAIASVKPTAAIAPAKANECVPTQEDYAVQEDGRWIVENRAMLWIS